MGSSQGMVCSPIAVQFVASRSTNAKQNWKRHQKPNRDIRAKSSLPSKIASLNRGAYRRRAYTCLYHGLLPGTYLSISQEGRLIEGSASIEADREWQSLSKAAYSLPKAMGCHYT